MVDLAASDEDASKIDLSQLTHTELGQLLVKYENLVRVMREANNSLILKLASAGATDEQMRIINDWSVFHNRLFDVHALELEMATAVVN